MPDLIDTALPPVIDGLAAISEDEWTTGTIAELAQRSQELRRLQSIIRSADKAIEDTLVGSMETDVMDIQGVGRLIRQEKTQTTWKYQGANDQMRDDLAAAVAQTVAIDVATGEIDKMKSQRRPRTPCAPPTKPSRVLHPAQSGPGTTRPAHRRLPHLLHPLHDQHRRKR